MYTTRVKKTGKKLPISGCIAYNIGIQYRNLISLEFLTLLRHHDIKNNYLTSKKCPGFAKSFLG